EIDHIKTAGITEAELAKAKNQYRLERFTIGTEGDELSSLQTALGRAESLAAFTLFDDDPSLVNTEIDRYMDVTADQIKRAAQEYFGAGNRSVLYIRPSESSEPSGAPSSQSVLLTHPSSGFRVVKGSGK
ncbi:MAG TPA: hypothetical protein VJX67_04500, partial [Blastocatellia bacterium]|nr:hypothetical protein [Blastocatellia bacterium]